jgi:phosphoribosylformylglycinamidine synthase
MKTVRVIIIRTAGTNCDRETAHAFTLAGAETELVHINQLTSGEKKLSDYQILAIPGGFTYGDDIASGKILANELKFKIEDDIQKFIRDGKLAIGICNGFQVLVKAGILPGMTGDYKTIESTLTLNDSARFEDRWIYLKQDASKSVCVWTKGIRGTITLPIAHGEGKFIPKDKEVLRKLREKGMIVFRYVDEKGESSVYPANPNGSVDDIAGITDPTGRIFGLMPHPERHITSLQHPYWTRGGRKKEGDGFAIFRNGVEFVKKYL